MREGGGLPRLGDRDSWISRSLWAVLLVTIPVTSSPLITMVIGRTEVSPLLGIPLLLLLAAWFLPYLFRGAWLPRLSVPLIIFCGVAVIAAIVSIFRPIPSFLGQVPEARSARGLVTLLAGVAIYFVVAKFPAKKSDLRRSLRWLYLGALILLIWSSVQGIFVIQRIPYPAMLEDIHEWISIRRLIRFRVVGLAYEPSWLANQLVMLYIPLWAASVARGYSVYRSPHRWISVEVGFLAWGLVIHFLTLSRVGLISIFASLGILILAGAWAFIHRLSALLSDGLLRRHYPLAVTAERLRIVILLAAVTLLVGTMVLVVYLASSLDPRIAQIFDTDYLTFLNQAEDPFMDLANRLRYAERVVYWLAAYRTFSLYPWLGVGLGNVGFFFHRTVHPLGYHLPEIIRIINGEAMLPNAKNLWIRLLAETGVVGFSSFIIWLIAIGFGASRLLVTSRSVLGVIGLAGLLALTAQFFEGFSVDSFALPQLWIIPGLVTAALSIAARAKGGDENG